MTLKCKKIAQNVFSVEIIGKKSIEDKNSINLTIENQV